MSTCNVLGVGEARVGETGFRSCRSKGCYILCDDGYDGRLAAQHGVAGEALRTGKQEQPRRRRSAAQQLKEAGDQVGGNATSAGRQE
ncbi:hypothetical protein J1605_008224 [Eschrichtius robustus]|uniref:Uncharacterized protein n=1 Tax=Eschrichtius robustus TaxID=9764 RepID=A0AB34H0D8_ESCRO|nr:hypothetical protein J1605_008224 [Eschrichtius robustus]